MPFLTVGTTSFDALVEAVDFIKFLKAVKAKGIQEIRLQIGRGTVFPNVILANDLDIKVVVYRYKTTYLTDVQEASLIISHAGAGSIMDALEAKKKLIVVVNGNLMDDHQQELAQALSERKHLIATTIDELLQVVSVFEPKQLVEYPDVNFNAFPQLIHQELCKD